MQAITGFLPIRVKIKAALEWQESYLSLIFLRDNLDCSVAIDYNLASPGVYTQLGQAEHDAKATKRFSAIRELTSACVDTIGKISLYGQADAICAVPPTPEKQ